MRKNLLALVAILLLSACASTYKPAEYPLRDGLIPAFNVAGTATVSNGQPSTEPVIVHSYAGSKWRSDLQIITAAMVQQTTSEIAKNGRRTGGGKAKTIELKVHSLSTDYVAFFYKSEIKFQAKLGNGKVSDKAVPHSSGSPMQDLNGCIAEGVMTLLNDETVRAYLAG